MREILYEFVDLDSVESFVQLGNRFGGQLRNGCLHFNTETVSGELFRSAPEPGLWIRKWKLTVSEKITLRKLPASSNADRKYCLVYFLNPSIFTVKKELKDVTLPTHRNNVFFTSNTLMDFSVVPKQPFYVLDIAFTTRWLMDQLDGLESKSTMDLHNILVEYNTSMSLLSCSVEEYKTLRELELFEENEKQDDVLFIRSRVYKLIGEFFRKFLQPGTSAALQGLVHYEQVMEAEKIVMSDLKHLQPIEKIAMQVNLSASTLLRQFHYLFGKGVEEYYIAKKMEMARMLIIRKKVAINQVAEMLGYKQASAFIETFTKINGYSPGTLKHWKDER